MVQTNSNGFDHPFPHGRHGAATDSVPLPSKLHMAIFVDKELGVFVAPAIPLQKFLSVDEKTKKEKGERKIEKENREREIQIGSREREWRIK